jgi:hypothetical protein
MADVTMLSCLPTECHLPATPQVPRGNFAAIKGKLPPANYATDMKDILGHGFGE